MSDDWFVGFQTGLKADFWRAAAEPWADADAAAIAALLDLPSGARVLDAPCGAGRIAVRLAERGLDVTGVDISPQEIEAARARGSSANLRGGRPARAPRGRVRRRRPMGQQLRLHALRGDARGAAERRARPEAQRAPAPGDEPPSPSRCCRATTRADLRGRRDNDARGQRVRPAPEPCDRSISPSRTPPGGSSGRRRSTMSTPPARWSECWKSGLRGGDAALGCGRRDSVRARIRPSDRDFKDCSSPLRRRRSLAAVTRKPLLLNPRRTRLSIRSSSSSTASRRPRC